MKLILSLLLIMSFVTSAKDLNEVVKYNSFEEAKEATSQLKFIVESTKAGLFASDVDGYVKEFSYTAKLDEKHMILSDMTIKIKVAAMDTDNESRDTKLHNLCLSHKEYPEIIVKVPGPLFLKETRTHKYKGSVYIRGKEKSFEIELSQHLENGKMIVSGETIWGLKTMEIPDPSILVAKLSDEIRIQIKIEKLL